MNPFAAIPVETFGAIAARHAAMRPDAAAIAFEGRRWTWRAFDAQANRVAHRLIADGVRPGDRVAYLGRNHDAVPILALACARAGAIFVPINWRLSAGEVAHILADAGASLLIVAEGFACDVAIPVVPATAVTGDDWPAAVAEPPMVSVAASDTVALFYTSGTTGLPKGVMLSHRSLFGTSTLRQEAHVAWDRWGPDDVTLVPVPLAHIGGFGMLARTLFFGGEVVIQPAFEPGAVLEAIAHQRISKIGLVPTAIRMILDHPDAARVDYSRIETMVYGAAPITADLLAEAIATFGCRFAQSYGMSETSGTCVALPPDDHDPPGNPRLRAAGLPLPGTELRIVADDGAILPPGAVGEIAIRCISAMNGYWHQPEATAAVLSDDGWYRSGDAGMIDADGYLFIKDRVKDMIVSGAENVYPAEVENVLAAHPAVAAVAVIGVPDARWGEAVKAVVVPAPGAVLDAEALIAWTRTRIAPFKAPRSIDLVDALPLGASGKVHKPTLRARYWAGAERGIN